MTVFLTGAHTLPIGSNAFDEFEPASNLLKVAGHKVVNSLDMHVNADMRAYTPKEFKKVLLHAMINCDSVALLDNYEQDEVTKGLVSVARYLEMDVTPLTKLTNGQVANA